MYHHENECCDFVCVVFIFGCEKGQNERKSLYVEELWINCKQDAPWEKTFFFCMGS